MMFLFSCFLSRLVSPRGTDKLKELSRQPVVVERVEQLLADSDPRVRQVCTPKFGISNIFSFEGLAYTLFFFAYLFL
jgi:hypothetical protein